MSIDSAWNRFARQTILLLVFAVSLPVQASEAVTVSTEQWARVRRAGDVVAIPGLAPRLANWNETGKQVITIGYEGGETGQVWAEQLRNWLVAMGIPQDSIRFEGGASSPGTIKMTFGDRK